MTVLIVGMSLIGLAHGLEETSRWPGYQRCCPRQIQVCDDIAYCCCNGEGLLLLDVSQPQIPVRLSQIELPGGARDVVVSGGIAYVVGDRGLSVIDVSNPAEPQLLEQVEAGAFSQVSTSGDLLCMTGWGGARVYDVSDPARPQQVSDYGSGMGVVGAGLFGHHALMAFLPPDAAGPLLQVVDFGDPAEPRVIWSETRTVENWYFYRIRIEDGIACIASRDEVWLMDISDPAAPRQIGTVNPPWYVFDAHYRGDHVYVANHSLGLAVYDMANPASPQLTRRVGATTYTCAGAIDGDHYYALDLYDGVHVIDISNPAAAEEVGAYNEVGLTWEVELVGNRAYVADGWSGLRILDVSDCRNPVELGSYPVEDARAVEIIDGIAYVAGGRHSGLWVLDVGDPANPVLLGYQRVNWGEAGNDLIVRNGFAFIAKGYCTSWTGVRVIDVRDPADPVLVDSYETAELLYDIEVQEGTLFVPNGGEIDILRIGPDGQLHLVGRTASGAHLSRVCVDGTRMYGAGSNSLVVFDISDLARPTELESHSPFWTPADLQLHAGSLFNVPYTYRGDTPIQVFDVRNGVWSGLTHEIETDWPMAVRASGNRLAVADRFGGVAFYGEPLAHPGIALKLRRHGGSAFLDLLGTTPGSQSRVYVSTDLQTWWQAYVVEGTGCTATCDVSALCSVMGTLYFQVRD